jgi:16S rRNA (guanine527-N7)-methyltransferase
MERGQLESLVGFGVEKEVMEDLERFVTLLRRWNQTINVVSRADVSEIWSRHVADSAKLIALLPASARIWVDLGSGGGFPGVVVAIFARRRCPELRVTMVESDQRKAAFLKVAVAELGLSAAVLNMRAEDVPPLGAHIVSARALAPLKKLLPLVSRHLDKRGIAILPKGRQYQDELEELPKTWTFSLGLHKTDPSDASVVLLVSDLSLPPKGYVR